MPMVEVVSPGLLDNPVAQSLVRELRSSDSHMAWQSLLGDAWRALSASRDGDDGLLEKVQHGVAAAVVGRKTAVMGSKEFFPSPEWEMEVPDHALKLALGAVFTALELQGSSDLMVWRTPLDAWTYINGLEFEIRELEKRVGRIGR